MTGEELNRRRLLLGLTVDQVCAVFGTDRLTWLAWETDLEPIRHPEALAEALAAIEAFRRTHRASV